KTWSAARFAEIDPDGFFDFQAVRPHVALVEGQTRRLEWPDNSFYHAKIPGQRRDPILLLGIEPNVRGRACAGLVPGRARDLRVGLVVTPGSPLGDVPHPRQAPVTGSATDPALVESLGLEPSRYEGPTGIVGVLHDACRTAGLASVSFWAAV